MRGHLFITRGDIRRLACDAWLLPTARDLTIERVWLDGNARLTGACREGRHTQARESCPGWADGSVRTMQMLPKAGEDPAVWLANVGGHGGTDIEWIVAAVPEFVRLAAARVGAPEKHRRDRALLAIPFVGTGEAGGNRRKGEVAQELIRQLKPALAETGVDVVLVARNDEALAAAQRARRLDVADAWAESWNDAFRDSDAALPLDDPFALGSELAGHARRDRLVVFIGAGVSAGAGLPQWTTLLERLAGEAGLPYDEVRKLDLLDQATVISAALERQGKTVGAEVQHQVEVERYALAHSLIATLPASEVITTNYDRLLEDAGIDARREFQVLDSQSVAGADRWLLKLHGSVDRPEDIVLTRDDYLGYGSRRAALRGVVQAMLLTRHMLFVGFGLSDDNFHAIAHDVRTALRSDAARDASPFGTALLVQDRPLFAEIWQRDITPAALAGEDSAIGVGARRVELLLDLILAESEGALAHFMDDSFCALLTDEERTLQQELTRLAPLASGDSPAASAVADLLRRLGWEQRHT